MRTTGAVWQVLRLSRGQLPTGCRTARGHERERRGALTWGAIYAVIPELRLRFPSHDRTSVPYGLAGVGGSYGEPNHGKEKAAGLGIHAKGFYPAFNVGLGVERFIARNVSLDLEGRWLYVWDHEFEMPNGPSGKGDFGQCQVGVGLRLYLLELGKHEHGS